MFEEYGLMLEGSKRFYKLDLSIRSYDLQDNVPYCLKVNGNTFKYSAWGDTIVALCNYLIEEKSLSDNMLLDFSVDWGDIDIFYCEKKTNSKELNNGMYVNCNHTSLHSCWLIEDLLNAFNGGIDDCEMLVRKHQNAEPKAVTDYFRQQNINNFSQYLADEKEYSTDKIDKLINQHFAIFNKYLKNINKAYYDFFLIDDLSIFSVVKSNFLSKYKQYTIGTNNSYEIAEKDIKLLQEYYKKAFRS